MPTALTESALAIGRHVSDFTRRYIAPRNNLHQEDQFPIDLWMAMGQEGLLGLSISEEHGGKGCSALDLSMAAHCLVKEGNNLGMALSLLIHNIVAHYVIELWGDDHQKSEHLPYLAKGSRTACFAVSEPKKGGHPKHISSAAVKTDNGYVLLGEKSYLTNGPIADMFVIIAKTGVLKGKNLFSAFLAPSDAPGLEVFPPLDIPFFRPALHGRIRFEDLELPKESLLGMPDSAYENIVLPTRICEDAMMMGAVTGALEKQAQLLSAAFKCKKGPFDEYTKMELGKLKNMLDTSKILSYEAAAMIDSKIDHLDQIPLILFFRNLAREYHIQLEIIMKNAKIKKEGLLETLTNELAASASIGIQIAKIRQMKLGAEFLHNNDTE